MAERASQEKIDSSYKIATEQKAAFDEAQISWVRHSEIVEQPDGTYALDLWLDDLN